MAKQKLYLYLARRDRKGIMLLSTFPAPKDVRPTRVADINSLNLPPKLTKEITETVHENRMLYEPWIESANSFGDLKNSLKKRGYRNLPLNQSPMHMPGLTPTGEEPTGANTEQLNQRKSMLRRGSDQARRT